MSRLRALCKIQFECIGHLMSRSLPVAAVALIAAVACMPLEQAEGGVTGEFKSLAESHEGKQVEAKVTGDVIEAPWRDEVRRGLEKYDGELTGFQKRLIRLSLVISSPPYRKLRVALLKHRMTSKRMPELRSLLRILQRSSVLRLLRRKGEWLRLHPASLRSSLAEYSQLKRDPAASSFTRRLGAILSRPRTSYMVRRLPPLRVILLLTPQQVASTPTQQPRKTRATSSLDPGDLCSAASEKAKAFFREAASKTSELLNGVGAAIVDLATKKDPSAPLPPPPVVSVLVGIGVGLVTRNPVAAVAAGAAATSFVWWAQAAATEALVNQVHLPPGGLQGHRFKRIEPAGRELGTPRAQASSCSPTDPEQSQPRDGSQPGKGRPPETGGPAEEAAPFKITTTGLESVIPGAYFAQGLGAEGGTPPYKWAVVSGVLPAGSVLEDDGTLWGRVESFGQAQVTVEASDSGGNSESVELQLSALPPDCSGSPCALATGFNQVTVAWANCSGCEIIPSGKNAYLLSVLVDGVNPSPNSWLVCYGITSPCFGQGSQRWYTFYGYSSVFPFKPGNSVAVSVGYGENSLGGSPPQVKSLGTSNAVVVK